MDKFFNVYPVRACEFVVNDGTVTVLYEKEKLSVIDKLFFKKLSQKPYKVDLDEIGSFVWQMCDGKNNVADIVEKARDHFGEKIEPAENRVKLFVEQLNRNKFVNLFRKRGEEDYSEKEKESLYEK